MTRDTQCDVQAYALDYLSQGFSVLPLKPCSKEPAILWQPLQAQLPTEEMIRWWFAESAQRRSQPSGHQPNIGIITGTVSCLAAIDYDPRHDRDGEGKRWLSRANLPATATVDTGRGDGGFHLYFRMPIEFEGASKVSPAPGVEILYTGHYVVAPPSIHPDTRRPYQWRDSFESVADAPACLLDTLGDPPTKPARPAILPVLSPVPVLEGQRLLDEALRRAVPGTRNETGFWLACQLRDDGRSKAEANMLMEEFATRVRNMGDPPYMLEEAHASLDQAFRRPPRDRAVSQTRHRTVDTDETQPALHVTAYALTETGFAEFLASAIGEDVRYVHGSGLWLVWDGNRWGPSNTGAMDRSVLDATRLYQRLVERIEDEDHRKRRRKFAESFENRRSRDNAMALLQSLRPVASEPATFDSDHMLLGVRNGTLDLGTCTFHYGRRQDNLTKSCAAVYNAEAQCPRWERFLIEVFAADTQLIEFVQRAVGYTLTGSVEEHAMFLLLGDGMNGKSVFVNVIETLMGDYATTTDFATFLSGKDRNAGAPTPELTARS